MPGLLPPSPAPPGSGCPQLHPPAATGRRRRSLTSTRTTAPRGANRRNYSPLPGTVRERLRQPGPARIIRGHHQLGRNDSDRSRRDYTPTPSGSAATACPPSTPALPRSPPPAGRPSPASRSRRHRGPPSPQPDRSITPPFPAFTPKQPQTTAHPAQAAPTAASGTTPDRPQAAWQPPSIPPPSSSGYSVPKSLSSASRPALASSAARLGSRGLRPLPASPAAAWTGAPACPGSRTLRVAGAR